MRVCLSGGMRCERWRGAPLLVDGGGCQLVGLSAFRLVDLLGSRKVGELAGRGGFLVYPGGKASAAVVWLVCRWVVAGQETEDVAGGLAALGLPGGKREKRQPARSGGAGASVRVGRKGCWVQGAGKRGGVMNRNDTVAGEYRAVVVYPAGKRT